MSYNASALLVVLALSTITFLPNSGVYAISTLATIDGTVTESGCRAIGGAIVTDTVDAQHAQIVSLCKFGSKYFKIVQYAECVASARSKRASWREADSTRLGVPRDRSRASTTHA